MVLRSVGVFSVAKVLAGLYACIGFIAGAFLALFALLGAGLAASQGGMPAFGMIFGVGAIIFLPIFYGVLGFIVGLIVGAVYNLIAGAIGGLELNLE